jgi:iron complex outermembrane receptor protein
VVPATFLLAGLQAPAVSAQLEEVLVTAERREMSIQDVPVAVSAFSASDLEKFQVEQTIDLVNIIPNLFGGNNTGLGTANMYYLRAQGNDESIATFDPAVGTYVDDVYITRQNANNFAFFDVERIEVLRGPQGTLFGRNTTGGAINVILKKPGEEFGGFAEVGFGRFDEYLGRASVDIPISETLLTKFSAFYFTDDGWLDNVTDGRTYNDVDNRGLRGALRWLPNDNLVWDLSIDVMDTDAANVDGTIVGDDRITTTILPGGLPPIPGWVQKSDYGNNTTTTSIVSNLGFDLGVGRTNFILGYRDLEQDFLLNFPGPVPGPGNDDFFWIDNDSTHEMLTAEVKWVGTLMDDRLTLVTGIFYLDESNTTDFADYLFGGLRLADRVLDNDTESYAVYAQGDFKVGENGTLTLGARYTDEDKSIGMRDNTGGNLNTAGIVAAGIPLSQSESKVTPRIAYAHDFSDDLMVYASATNGFKSGGWNARGTVASALEPFGPEEIWSYEIGTRAEWLEGTLRTNVTVFYSEVEDLQTTAATPSGQFLTTNAGGLEVTGLEAEVFWLPMEFWEVFVSLGLQDAEYVDLPGGCVVPNNSIAAYDANCNVADPKRSPDITLTVGTSADFNLPAIGSILRPFGTVRHIGENVVGTSQTGVNDSVTIYNLGISLVDDMGKWQATLECSNCADEEYITSFLFNEYYTPPGRWQARVRWNF